MLDKAVTAESASTLKTDGMSALYGRANEEDGHERDFGRQSKV